MKLKYINEEQIRQIERHKWIRSEQEGYDIGVVGYIEWACNYAGIFREWSEHIPDMCIQCGLTGCQGPDSDGDCVAPFNEVRLNLLKRKSP